MSNDHGGALNTEILANLVEKVTRDIEAGQPIDIELYCADCPGHAEQLRQLLPALGGAS